MPLSFAGKEIRKFDQVNRMSIPPSFRQDLGETIFLMKSIHGEPCLIIYPEEEWLLFSKGFISSFSGEMQAKAQRKLMNKVEKLTVDKSGRISIKDDFKAYAGLDEEVLVVGSMNRVELWTSENWKIWCDDSDDDIDFSGVSYIAQR